MIKEFNFAFVITGVFMAFSFWYGWRTGGFEAAVAYLLISALLGVMEVSLSFDNAVVNASVLTNMAEKWRQRFLTWGIIIAVIGMRLIFPVAIVAVTSHLGFFQVASLALNNPEVYARHLEASNVAISAFGGVFLLLVALNYLMDPDKDTHWLGEFERRLAGIGKLDTIQVVISLAALLVVTLVAVPTGSQLTALIAGLVGAVLYLLMNALGNLFDTDNLAARAGAAGLSAFLYLEVLDASFSLDGVIGAFAITKVVVVIAAGLGIGAVFVRSLTLYLVHQGTLAEYRYLEHGAHYGILALAVIMLISTSGLHVPEVVTGLIGVGFIGLSLWSSLRANRRETQTN